MRGPTSTSVDTSVLACSEESGSDMLAQVLTERARPARRQPASGTSVLRGGWRGYRYALLPVGSFWGAFLQAKVWALPMNSDGRSEGRSWRGSQGPHCLPQEGCRLPSRPQVLAGVCPLGVAPATECQPSGGSLLGTLRSHRLGLFFIFCPQFRVVVAQGGPLFPEGPSLVGLGLVPEPPHLHGCPAAPCPSGTTDSLCCWREDLLRPTGRVSGNWAPRAASAAGPSSPRPLLLSSAPFSCPAPSSSRQPCPPWLPSPAPISSVPQTPRRCFPRRWA